MQFTKLVSQIQKIHENLQKQALQNINKSLVIRNWLIGMHIFEYEQNGADRAKYGEKLLEKIAHKLSHKGTRGFSERALQIYRKFYLTYPQISQTLSAKSLPTKNHLVKLKYNTDTELLLQHFSFSHFVELLKVEKELARSFYEIQAIKGRWSVRQLQRQIGSLLYERTGLSKNKIGLVKKLSKNITSIEDTIRDPYILEFAGLKEHYEYSENILETAILDHIEEFLLELGKGFCFESRQKRITIDNEHNRIDLVFYHRHLKCHVLFDLKVRPFTHADAGQMNFYLNYFKENEMNKNDNPPIGIILCTHKDTVKVKYATGGLNNKLFVSQYLIELPTEKQIEDFVKKDINKIGKSKT